MAKQGRHDGHHMRSVKTPARRKRERAARGRQEKYWASQSGPVVVRKISNTP